MDKKLFGIFTTAKNQSTFLPIWLDYYSKIVSMQDIYILDDGSTDGSTDNLDCNVIKIDHPFAQDHVHITDMVNNMQSKMLQKYQYIMYAQTDGIVKHLQYENLLDYIKHLKDKQLGNIRCRGVQIWHNRQKQKDYNPKESILSQRNYWFSNDAYSVPCISNYKLNYTMCFHQADNMCNYIQQNLLFIHLHRFDYNLHMSRKLSFNSLIRVNQSPQWGWQNKLSTQKQIHDYFVMPYNCNKIESIPENIKNMNFI